MMNKLTVPRSRLTRRLLLKQLWALCGIFVFLHAAPAFSQQQVYSSDGTNWIANVHAAGTTNNNTYMVISNQFVAVRIRVGSISSNTVFLNESWNRTDFPTVQTNPVAGIPIAPGEVKTIEEWPLIFDRKYSAFTTNGAGKIWIRIDQP